MMRRAALVATAILAVALPATTRADVQKIAGDGTVHRIDVEPFIQAGKPIGTVLKSTRQRPNGGKDVSFISGTDDAAIDRDPALEIDPARGTPLVVWSRNDGTGYNVYIAKFDNGQWCTPRLLIKTDADDFEPRVRIDANYLHVFWRQEYAGQNTYWRWTYKTSTLEPMFGPERLPTDDATVVTPAGGDATVSTDLPWSTRFSCASIFSKIPGEPGRSYVWGVRDEPVPITFRQAFILPAEVKGIVASDAEWLGGRLTYWFSTTDRVYYTTYYGGKWAEMRIVELSASMSASDARLLIFDLNRRLSSGGV